MDTPQRRLIEAAVRPFGDNAEMKHAAGEMLGVLVDPEAQGAEEAIARWETVDARKNKTFWRRLLFSLFLIISAGIWADGLHAVFYHNKLFGDPLIDSFYGYPARDDERAPDFPNLSAGQKLLLFGDTSKSSKSDKMKGLWDSDPGNPAYFAAYTNAFLADHKKLPPDFLATARRIDPRNSWFTPGRRRRCREGRGQNAETERGGTPCEQDTGMGCAR